MTHDLALAAFHQFKLDLWSPTVKKMFPDIVATDLRCTCLSSNTRMFDVNLVSLHSHHISSADPFIHFQKDLCLSRLDLSPTSSIIHFHFSISSKDQALIVECFCAGRMQNETCPRTLAEIVPDNTFKLAHCPRSMSLYFCPRDAFRTAHHHDTLLPPAQSRVTCKVTPRSARPDWNSDLSFVPRLCTVVLLLFGLAPHVSLLSSSRGFPRRTCNIMFGTR